MFIGVLVACCSQDRLGGRRRGSPHTGVGEGRDSSRWAAGPRSWLIGFYGIIPAWWPRGWVGRHSGRGFVRTRSGRCYGRERLLLPRAGWWPALLTGASARCSLGQAGCLLRLHPGFSRRCAAKDRHESSPETGKGAPPSPSCSQVPHRVAKKSGDRHSAAQKSRKNQSGLVGCGLTVPDSSTAS